MKGYMHDQWRLLRSAGMASFDNVRISLLERMARTGLAVAGAEGATAENHKAGLAMARKAHRLLKKETLPWSRAVTDAIQAGLLAAEGDRAGAAALLLKATEEFSEVEMRANEASCRLYAGYLIGAERGAGIDAVSHHSFPPPNL